MRLPNTRQNDIVFKIPKDIVWIEPMNTKLVQGVYCRWMAVKLKSKMTELYTTHVTPREEILLASIAKRKRHIPQMWRYIRDKENLFRKMKQAR